jgi:hypothetical protein
MQVEMRIGNMTVRFHPSQLEFDIYGHKREIPVERFQDLVETIGVSRWKTSSVYFYVSSADESCIVVIRDLDCNESQHLSKGEIQLLKIAVYSYYGLNK